MADRVACVLAFSRKYAHVREATGNNDGWQVEQWQRQGGGRPGKDPWCGFYELARQWECDLPFPAGAGGSYNWFRLTSKRTGFVRGVRGSIDSLRVGYKVGIYYKHLGRIGHIGTNIAAGRSIRDGRPPRGYYIDSGNTGRGGGRDGAGVHVIYYTSPSIGAWANWLN